MVVRGPTAAPLWQRAVSVRPSRFPHCTLPPLSPHVRPPPPDALALALYRDQRPTIVPTGPYKNVFDIAYFKRAPGAAPAADAAAAPTMAPAASPFLSAVRFRHASWVIFFFFLPWLSFPADIPSERLAVVRCLSAAVSRADRPTDEWR